MKTIKNLLIIFILELLSIISYSQEIATDTTLANNYMIAADKYFENTIYDSSAYTYEMASELYWKYYIETNNKELLKNFIHCQNYYAVNLSVYGYSDTALFIINKSESLCHEYFNPSSISFAETYYCYGCVYYSIDNYNKAMENLIKALNLQKQLFGDYNKNVAFTHNIIGIIYELQGDYDKALENYYKVITIYDYLNSHILNKARTLENIGGVYRSKGEFDVAIDYFTKSLILKRNTYGINNKDVASSYNSFASMYIEIGEYNLALEYLKKSIDIYTELFGSEYHSLCEAYLNRANAYYYKGELNLALEYYNKSLLLTRDIYGAVNLRISNLYNNIGNIYSEQKEFGEALTNLQSSLQIRKKVFGDEHSSVANSYSNIGNLYFDKGDYDSALVYYDKTLKIRTSNLGNDHYSTGLTWMNAGMVFLVKEELDSAIIYFNKAQGIFYKTFGKKHPYISSVLAKKSVVYYKQKKYFLALNQIQQSIISNLKYFNDSINIYKTPDISYYSHWENLINSLIQKAQILTSISSAEMYQQAALSHYQTCDTLINRVRQSISTKSDKIALGEYANQVYALAIGVCNILSLKANPDSSLYYKNLAFYFSERNKSSVLLEALAGSEAQKFAGIPDTLLQKEHKLSIDIALYNKLLAEQPDSTDEIKYRNKLFTANRRYDELIASFEIDYPKYFELKYNRKPASVEKIQHMLDNKTALISYFTSDSVITVFAITKNDLKINTIPTIENLADTIKYYRYGLIYTTSKRFADIYKKYAYKFFRQLIPESLNSNIENLIIIPDAELSMIPFETLLTEEAENKDWNELSYLTRKYTISYSYSATLFYFTFPKESSTKIKTTGLNDWLAFAPVFDDSNTAGLTLKTRELLQVYDSQISDSIGTRGRLADGGFISPLPGTESEVQSIFKEFDDKGKKALVQIKKNANEEFVKSGGLKNYRFLHFATHGFVNTEKPELSGIFLAQDSTLSEDGILYSDEIYNLELNADLTVLSACETGLGKIKKGEGLIGLTRALLYAGSRNIIVSLWKVADESTSDLMIDFYKNLLEENKEKPEFSKALQKAKLKMIDEGKYAHPFYWSPFILIGK